MCCGCPLPSEGEGTRVCVFHEAYVTGTAMRQQESIVVNEILCYIWGVRKTFTVRQIHEAVISVFNTQKLHDAF